MLNKEIPCFFLQLINLLSIFISRGDGRNGVPHRICFMWTCPTRSCRVYNLTQVSHLLGPSQGFKQKHIFVSACDSNRDLNFFFVSKHYLNKFRQPYNQPSVRSPITLDWIVVGTQCARAVRSCQCRGVFIHSAISIRWVSLLKEAFVA